MSKKRNEKKAQRTIAKKATYRVLARQPLSVEVEPDASANALSIQGVACSIAIRPAYSDAALQREFGGSLLTIEFDDEHDADLLIAARNGFELIEDFLSAIAVVKGVTFHPCVLIQVARLDREKGQRNCEFLQFLELPANHWSEPLSKKTIWAAQKLLAHWDGLEIGKRLRRAARQYREAIGDFDDATAFQEAYIGLEAMEPPLAKMAGLQAGTEEVKGICGHCGVEFTRKKTSLVGVRAFVLGNLNPANADEQRKVDWRQINQLRNDLMHGLVDGVALGKRAHDGLIASMHYLHSGICFCSHAPDLAMENYRLARGGSWYVLGGIYTTNSWSALTHWSEVQGNRI